jgi:4-amino-4-deoxy-L-arabinose transferase-like glycosyltransferase
MVESGQWLFPHRGMELYADKPPMLMWLEAGFFELLGSWRLAFLLPSLLAGLGTLALVYDLGRRLWNARTGLAAAALLLSALQFVEEVKHAQIDPLAMLWITLGNWGLLVHCLRGPDWRAYWLGCFAAGLGVITKGVGVLALLMLVPYALARRRGWIARASRDVPAGQGEGDGPAGHGWAAHESRAPAAAGDGWRWAGGALAFLGAIALWLAPMLAAAYGLRTPAYLAYVRDILFHQTADRYVDSWAHAQPFWFYAQVLVRSWFPLCLLYLPMLPHWRRALRERDARLLLPLLWCALVVLFFSIPRGKREVYVLPALPMMALAMAPYLGGMLRGRWLHRLGLGLALLAGAAYLGGSLWALLAHPRFARRLADGYELARGGRGLWLATAAVGVVFLAAAALGRARRGAWAFAGGMAAAWVAWSLATYPLLNANQSMAGLMRAADARIGPGGELGLVAWREEALLQAVRPPVEFGFTRPWHEQMRDALAWQAGAPRRRWILLDADAALPRLCVDRARTVRLGVANRNEWRMFDGAAVLPGCRPRAGDATGR